MQYNYAHFFFTRILNIHSWKIITLLDYKLLHRYSNLRSSYIRRDFTWTEQGNKHSNVKYLLICMLIFAVGLLTDAPVVCWHAENAQTLADFNATLRDGIPSDIDQFPLILSASLKANISPVLTVTVPYNSWCSKVAQNEPQRVITGTAEVYENA